MRQRTGLILMLVGILLAGATALLVVRIANQATEASRAPLRQVAVVMASREIPDQTQISPEFLTIRPFPVDFAPVGALGSIDQVVGKFANGFIAKDQILVAQQVSPAVRSPLLSDRVPPGKVAVWLPMPPLLAQAGVLRPGDHVDLLLSLAVPGLTSALGPQGEQTSSGNLSTQTTLQNVEVFRLGVEEINLATQQNQTMLQQQNQALEGSGASTPRGQVPAPNPAAQSGNQGQAQGKPQTPAAGVIGFLLDHQEALTIKHLKDIGGNIDIVLRSSEEEQIVRTDPVTTDALIERFRFRVPAQGTR